jgi:hypothetical protein
VAARAEDKRIFEAERIAESARNRLKRDDDFCQVCGSTLSAKRCGECGALAHGKVEKSDD